MEKYYSYEVILYDVDTDEQSIRQGVVSAVNHNEAVKKVRTFYPRRYTSDIVVESMEDEDEKEKKV